MKQFSNSVQLAIPKAATLGEDETVQMRGHSTAPRDLFTSFYLPVIFHSGAAGISPRDQERSPKWSSPRCPHRLPHRDVSVRESSCWLAVFVHTFFLLDVLGDYVWCLKEEADGGGSQRQQELSNKSERKGPCGQQGMTRWEGSGVGLPYLIRLSFRGYWSSARKRFPKIRKKKFTKPRLPSGKPHILTSKWL